MLFIFTSSSVGQRPTNEGLDLTWDNLKIRKRTALHRPTRKLFFLTDPPTGKWLKFTKISCTFKQVLVSSGLKDSYTSYSCRSSYINKRPNKEWKSSPLRNRESSLYEFAINAMQHFEFNPVLQKQHEEYMAGRQQMSTSLYFDFPGSWRPDWIKATDFCTLSNS